MKKHWVNPRNYRENVRNTIREKHLKSGENARNCRENIKKYREYTRNTENKLEILGKY